MLLQVVYLAANSGVSSVRDALLTVLTEGEAVLFKQLSSWLTQGSLYDPHREFFILPEEGGGEGASSGDHTDHSLLSTQSAEGLEVKLLNFLERRSHKFWLLR